MFGSLYYDFDWLSRALAVHAELPPSPPPPPPTPNFPSSEVSSTPRSLAEAPPISLPSGVHNYSDSSAPQYTSRQSGQSGQSQNTHTSGQGQAMAPHYSENVSFFQTISVSPDAIPAAANNPAPFYEDMDILGTTTRLEAIDDTESDTIDSPVSVPEHSQFPQFGHQRPSNPLLERTKQLELMAQKRFGRKVPSDNNEDDGSLNHEDSVDHGGFVGRVNNTEDQIDTPEEDNSPAKHDTPCKEDSFDGDTKPKRTKKKTVTKKDSAQPKKDPDQPKKERRRPNNYGTDPWPDWPKPTPKECEEVNRLLTISEGESKRPDKLVVDTTITGCGEVPDVLDALCRTALSLNTTVENSNKALKALIDRFGTVPTEQEAGPQHRNYRGYGTVDWDAVRNVDKHEIADAIKAGGLNNYKAETIKKILDSVWKEGQLTLWQQRAEVSGLPADTIAALPHDAPGQLTLDYLHNYSDAEVMDKLTSYWGIGPKAAACVAMFSLGRNIFPVDTHVMRLSGYLGWIPEEANDKTAFYHLDARIPNELKYSLHNLLIRHGMRCKYCKGKPMKPEVSPTSSKFQDPDASSAKKTSSRNQLKRIKTGPEPKLDEPESSTIGTSFGPVFMSGLSPIMDQDGNPIGVQRTAESSINVANTPAKPKKTRTVWTGNGLMKQQRVEVETDDEFEWDEKCILEHLVHRVQKAKKVSKAKKEDAKDEVKDEVKAEMNAQEDEEEEMRRKTRTKSVSKEVKEELSGEDKERNRENPRQNGMNMQANQAELQTATDRKIIAPRRSARSSANKINQ